MVKNTGQEGPLGAWCVGVKIAARGAWSDRAKWVAPGIGPICILVMFAGVLSGRERLAFRDVGYFYTPLYHHVAQLCHQQNWGAWGDAIWNPSDQTGMPLAGETTTAVFYPLRMLVYSPAWSAEMAMGVYVVLHLIIASLTAYFSARRFRCVRWSAAIAGVMYPLSGMVLFLATNPPFLVGAAWLPLLMTPLIIKQRGMVRAVLIPAVAMSMIILGGDPPTALHAVIIAGTVAVFRMAIACCRRKTSLLRQFQIAKVTALRAFAVVTLAAVLAAPQIAASIAWSAQSDRVRHNSAPEIFKIHEQVDAFSVPPWRFAEFVVPNLYGTPWPINTRWDRLVFDGGQMRPETALWTPTLYSGLLLPVLIVLGWHRSQRRLGMSDSQIDAAIFIVFLLSIAAAMGAYGPVHRLLHAFLPGYNSLRYPAKWLPFAAFAVAIASARVARRHEVTRRADDHAVDFNRSQTRTSRLRWGLVWIGFIAISTFAAVAISRLHGRISDPFWGPFLPGPATWHFLFSSVCAAALIAAIALARHARWWLAVITIDLMIAHHQLVPTVNRAAESRLLAGEQQLDSSLRWMRVNQNGGFPIQWSEQSDPHRMLTVEAGLRLARFGRWHLEHDAAVVNNLVSIGSYELAEFWYYAKLIDRAEAALPEHHWRGWARLLGVGGLLRCRGGNIAALSGTSDRFLPVITQERLSLPSNALQSELTIRRHVVPIGTDRAATWSELLLAYSDEQVEVPARVPADISTNSERVVVSRRVYQDGNWFANLSPRENKSPPLSAEVFPVDFLSQGILCPPGKWRIEFYYAPWWHPPAICLAAGGWIAVLMAITFTRFRIPMRRRSLLEIQRR